MFTTISVATEEKKTKSYFDSDDDVFRDHGVDLTNYARHTIFFGRLVYGLAPSKL